MVFSRFTISSSRFDYCSIAATDRAIDQLVYQLYGLTDNEIALVETAGAPAAAKSIAPDDEASGPGSTRPSATPAIYNAQAKADAAHHYFIKEDTSSNSRIE